MRFHRIPCHEVYRTNDSPIQSRGERDDISDACATVIYR